MDWKAEPCLRVRLLLHPSSWLLPSHSVADLFEWGLLPYEAEMNPSPSAFLLLHSQGGISLSCHHGPSGFETYSIGVVWLLYVSPPFTHLSSSCGWFPVGCICLLLPTVFVLCGMKCLIHVPVSRWVKNCPGKVCCALLLWELDTVNYFVGYYIICFIMVK